MSTETKQDELPEVQAEAMKDATVWNIANIIAGSRDFPSCRTPEKAAVRILAGKEMGIGPIASVDGIRIENGKICVSAAIFESIVDSSPKYDWKLHERDDQHCKIEFFRNGESRGVIDYTIANAAKAGLLGKKGENWTKHPEAMLTAAAFRTGARLYCAGAFGGNAVYTPDELGLPESENTDPSNVIAGGELCTRDQRQAIYDLLSSLGIDQKTFIADLGVNLLDEISVGEAAKIIKDLEKKSAKQAAKTQTEQPTVVSQAQQTEPPKEKQHAVAEAFQEGMRPITRGQVQQILSLAGQLVPDENACMEMLQSGLTKRGLTKITELDYLAANAWIETFENGIKIMEEEKEAAKKQPPFEPN
jgi:hypothetical protein